MSDRIHSRLCSGWVLQEKDGRRRNVNKGGGGVEVSFGLIKLSGQGGQTRGTFSAAVRPQTRGTFSTAVRPQTRGTLSTAVRPQTRGTFSAAVRPQTRGTFSTAVRPQTRGTLSRPQSCAATMDRLPTCTMPAQTSEKILLEPYTYICQIPGKQIRTKLSIAFNHWMKIPEDKQKLIGEVIQMLHNASLIIDDIEDNSKLRRGIPVAHSIFGVAHTINSANYVYFLALNKLNELNSASATQVFTEQLLELHRGQGMDIYWRDAVICPTEEDYKLMVIRKTGGLFGLAVRLMQLFSQNKSDFKPLLDVMGLYFQIRDDYANLLSDEYKANKSYCEDLTEGKFSFPIIHAVRADLSNTTLLNVLRQRTADNDVKKYCVDYMKKMGSFDYTSSVLVDLEKRALALIDSHGGNPVLSSLVKELSKVYTQPPSPHSPTGDGLAPLPPLTHHLPHGP